MADDQLVTLGFLKRMMSGMGKTVREKVLAPTDERLAKLEDRIAALEAKRGSSDGR